MLPAVTFLAAMRTALDALGGSCGTFRSHAGRTRPDGIRHTRCGQLQVEYLQGAGSFWWPRRSLEFCSRSIRVACLVDTLGYPTIRVEPPPPLRPSPPRHADCSRRVGGRGGPPSAGILPTRIEAMRYAICLAMSQLVRPPIVADAIAVGAAPSLHWSTRLVQSPSL